jgi:hypothetical protein
MHYSGMERHYLTCSTPGGRETIAVRTEYNAGIADKHRATSLAIIIAPEPPEKVSTDPTFYICKMCPFAELCHGAQLPAANCRTCAHSTPELDGNARWSCAKWKASVPNAHLRDACPSHVFLPVFFRDSIVLDAGTNESPWLHMKHGPSGREFVHGPRETAPALEGVPVYGSDELAGQPALRYYDPVRADLTVKFGPLLEAEVPF